MRRDVIISIFKGVSVLALISLACAILLACINIVTYTDPKSTTLNKFRTLSRDIGNEQEFVMIESDNNYQIEGYTNGQILYYAKSTDKKINAFLAQGRGGYGGRVDIYVLIDSTSEIVKSIAIGNNSETFLDILNKADFLNKNFIGKKIATISNLSGLDGYTGATMSATAIDNAMLAIKKYYETIRVANRQYIAETDYMQQTNLQIEYKAITQPFIESMKQVRQTKKMSLEIL